MAVSYKSLTTLKSDIFSSNRQVELVELIKSYYGVDNIDILDTTVCDGGSEWEIKYILVWTTLTQE